MKKIPTLFERDYNERGRIIGIRSEVKPGFEWVLDGEGIATVKIDGSCCAIIDGKWYKRYDAKKGKNPPIGAIPCQEAPDPITGHWPHWVELDADNPADKWFIVAFHNGGAENLNKNLTVEAIGPHFQGNPYKLDKDVIVVHGSEVIDCPRSFEGIRDYLEKNYIEGIVFWKDGEPKCKIKRSDFGYKWG